MELTAWTIYWVGKLDAIQETFEAAAVLLGIWCAIAGVFYAQTWWLEEDEGVRSSAGMWFARRALTTGSWLFGVFLAAAVLAPSTAHMSAMLVAPKVAQYVEGNEALKQLPDQIVEAASGWLKEKASVK